MTPDRRGRPTHRLRPVAARYLRWPTGRGCSSPVIAGGCHLTVSRPVGRAVPATVIRAGVHVLGAARSPIAGDCLLTVSRPAGRAVPAMAIRAGRVTPTAGGCHHTVSTSLPPTTAGQSAAFPHTTGPGPQPGRSDSAPLPGPPLLAGQSAASPCDLRARARGRAGTGSGRSPQSASRPTSVSPSHHRVSQTGQRTPADRQVWGTDSDTSRRRATAGPGRQHVTRTLRAWTTRHGDEAAASSSCRLPALVKVLQGCTPCTE